MFPKYHPKAGQPTYFVEKFWASIKVPIPCSKDQDKLTQEMYNLLSDHDFMPKHHTIGAGHRWKVGDKFSPRVWSGRPYNSKQLVLSDDIEIKKVWDFASGGFGFSLDGRVYDGELESHYELLEQVAINDGLDRYDLMQWFKHPKTFRGQIICWNDSINY